MYSKPFTFGFLRVNRLIYLVLLLCFSTLPAQAVVYYVNNQSTNGNVYTTAAGNDANDGLTPATPKFTVTNLLASYTLTQGDVVYIDTGTYSNYTVFISVSGVATNPIIFQGSTNYAAGGTVFIRNSSGADAWSLSSVSHVWLRDLTMRGARDGVLLSAANDIRMERVIARNNSRHGVYVSPNSHRAVMRNFIAAFNSDFQVRVQTSTNAVLEHAVLWGTRAVQYDGIGQSFLFVSNSVLRASGFASEIYRRSSPVMADHNLYVLENNAVMGTLSSALFNSTPRLSDWQAAYGVDFRSTVLDPLFADPDNLDFHPRSQFGRFVQATGTFTNDTVTSPLIDMGARASPFTNETSPNGGRVNVGAYGNTAEASRSPTNRTLLALSFNDGGVLSGTTGRVFWVAGNAATSDTVRVEYSPDGGSTWQQVATNVPATNEVLVWNTTLFQSSGAAKWRVRYETAGFTNTVSTNAGFFSLRNTNLAFYVNDGSTTGDMFTTAVGAPGNIATTNAPKDSLERVLTNHTISAGDTIYIDSGFYATTNTIFMNYRHRGEPGNPVRIVGAPTNGVMGGAVLDRSNNFANVISASSAPHLYFRNIEARGGATGISLSQSPFVEIDRCILRLNFTHGVDFSSSSDNGILRNSLVLNNVQRALTVGSTNILIQNNTIYGARGIFSTSGSSLRFENNVIRASTSSGAAFETLAGTTFLSPSDYNLYFVESGAVIGRDGVNTYTRLIDYQKQFNRDWRSTVANPLFADVTAGDFRVRSESGRWTGTAWTNDAVTSPLIDLGNPTAVFTNETAPNGGRINSDGFGNTPEASRSRTNAWLQALTYADGGTLNVPGDAIYWNAGAFPTGATVRIELSTDSGASWSVVETGLAVTSGVYVWANTNFLSSRFARWRVVSESNTNVFAGITNDIVFRNGPFVYYVNNSSTEGDVYCTAPGNDANLGTSPGSPKASLKSLVDTHSVEAGDIIYVDTGVYNFTINQEITSLDAGNTNDFVYVIGSTNDAAGGTIFSRNSTISSAYGLHLNGAGYVWVRNFTFRNNGVGIRVENSPGVRLENVRSRDNSGPGIQLRSSSGVRVEHSASWANQVGILQELSGQATLNHLVLWRNSQDGLRVDAGLVSLTNSVIVASGAFATAYRPLTATNIFANYNNILVQTQALVAVIQMDNRWADTLSAWTALAGRDTASLSEEPLFANPSDGDFHLRTEATAGRFLPGVGFVVDSETSRLIDAGDPSASFANEPSPNGGRVNIGMFGNTAQASKSRTNASLYAASLRQGGSVAGTVTLHWVAYNLPTSHLVTVEYSRNGGVTWVSIATGISARAEAVVWNTTTASNSPAGLWRVRSESNPTLVDQTTEFFSIRNAPLSIFVNDSATAGDVYTVAPGAATNWVATAAQPISSLPLALSLYNLEPGDTVYIDTGNYSTAPTTVGRRHAGFSNIAVTIRGSTNVLAGGSVLVGQGLSAASFVLSFENTRSVAISNLTIRNARTGVFIDRADRFSLDFVHSHSNSNGVWLRGSTNVVIRQSTIANNFGWGLINQGSGGTNRVEYSVLLSNSLYAVDQSAGRMEVEACVLSAYGPNSFVYHVQSNSTLIADYNNVLTYGDANVARSGFSISKALSRWRELTTNDLRSLSHEPLFANALGGDYHPRSPAGRFDPASGTFVTTDTNRSPLIDAGPPSADFSQETAPNGARVNIGLFGNHPEASRSPTNGVLYTLSLNDGGSARENTTLYWLAGGAATGALVHIDYSHNGGITWTNIATNVAASAGAVGWNTTNYPSSAAAYWRVTVQGNPSISATNERAFSINNQPLAYYVNDASTDGDIYTSAPGSPFNDGLTAFSPVHSLQTIFDRYDVRPGDRIFVDTGSYLLTNAVFLSSDRYVGSATNALRIIGSTNWAFGGTRINRNNGAVAFSFSGIAGLEMSYFSISNAAVGLRVNAGTGTTLEWLDIKGAGTAIELIGSTNTVLRHTVIRESSTNALANLQSTGTVWQSGTMWSNRVSVFLGTPLVPLLGGPQNSVTFSNSIIVSFGANATAYQINNGQLFANYNNIKLTNGALMARQSGVGFYTRVYDSLARWTEETGQDSFSLSKDPMFADPESGNFFLKSSAGRYNPATQTFVNDPESSPLIDAGAPGTAAATNEPAPNGGRINIGSHGGSMFASRTPTNPAITLISWNDGGRVSGISTVRWIARGSATGHVMGLYVSTNGGVTFSPINTNIIAGTNQFAWNTALFSNTPRARLLIINATVSQPMDRTDGLFSIRNTPLTFFVNDGSLAGDMYTTQIGLPTNTGLAANNPLPSLAAVLERWDVDPGDTIYIDTGVYTSVAPIVITQLDAGSSTGGLPVSVIGSTNRAAGGTRLLGVNTNALLQVIEVSRINLRNLTLEAAARPLLLRRVEEVGLEFVDIVGGLLGLEIDGSRNIQAAHNVIRQTASVGLQIAGASNLFWNSGVFWSNRTAVQMALSTNFATVASQQPNIVGLSNTLLGAIGSNAVIFDVRAPHSLRSDYNALYRLQGASLAVLSTTNSPLPLFLTSLERWSSIAGNDRFSLTQLDPQVADPNTGDFHLRSTVGRFDPASSTFVTDLVTSPLIDAGAPSSPFTNETAPNGGRINIGRYGNTAQASRSATNSRLNLLLFRDGGVAAGPTQLVTWAAFGNATSHTVSLDVSLDGGATWTNIATNVSASAGSLVWNTTNHPSSPAAVLRIRSDQEPGVSDASANFIAIRNGPIVFYVNDGSLAGDLYTTAPGMATNLGVSPSTPMSSLQGILERWDLAPGDTVYVDTGVYTNNTDIFIDQKDAGGFSNTVKVAIIGSTNVAAGGSRIVRSGGNGINLLGAGAVILRHLRIMGADTGVRMNDVEGIDLEWIDVSGAQTGFVVEKAENLDLSRCVARNCSSLGVSLNMARAVRWRNGVLWDVASGIQILNSAQISVSNSVFGLFITNGSAYSSIGVLPPTFSSDYNNFYLLNGARAATVFEVLTKRYSSVNDWFRGTGRDANSLSHNPLFADPDAGNFHPLSQGGRYDVTSGVFVIDALTSPLIDAGSASDAFSFESAPNGGRRNIGLYGNTPLASRSPTNTSLLVVSLNDGGRAEGIRDLIWIPRGAATGHTVRLEYSHDDGATWTLIASNVAAATRRFTWDTRPYISSVRGYWRISSEQNPSVNDQSDRRFALRNQGLQFFVNDGSVAGDVYTTAAGNPTNHGVLASAPNNSITNILRQWDIEPGDTIYVDTGTYLLTAPIVFGTEQAWVDTTNLTALAAGLATNRVLVQGSTNVSAGGTLISIFGANDLFQVVDAPGVAFRHLTLGGGAAGIRFTGSPYAQVDWVRRNGGTSGFVLQSSPNATFRHNVVRSASVVGLDVQFSPQTVWRNGVMWSNMIAFRQDAGLTGVSSLSVENSIIGAFGASAVGYFNESGTLLSDYNNIYTVNGAFVGAIRRPGSIVTTRLESISFWYNETGQDHRSLSVDPNFANALTEDFHLRSTAPSGRFNAVSSVWTNDADFSRLIDAGNPATSIGSEPAPNGGRINIDRYGGTSEASRTPTNAWLSVLYPNDNSSIRGTVTLTWHAGGSATGHLVTLEWSPVGDLAWTNIASNVPASAGAYVWNTEDYGKAACGRWRIVSQTSTAVFDVSRGCATMRDNSGSIPYFVNDSSTNGDVYCTAPGSVTNNGLLPSTPMRSVQDVLNTYKLEPVDVIYVDTGNYLLTQPIRITDLDSGNETNRITLRGSTNLLAGGTVLDRQEPLINSSALLFEGASGWNVYDIRVKNGAAGIALVNSEHIRLERIRAEDNGSAGISLNDSANIEVIDSIIVRNGTVASGSGIRLDQSTLSLARSTIWDNFNAVSLDASTLLATNNSFGASFPNGRIFFMELGADIGSVISDYNNFFTQSGALLLQKVRLAGGDIYFQYLHEWTEASGQDVHSLAHDPLYVDSTNRVFFLRSAAGRPNGDGGITNDAVFSPLIDAGSKTASFTNEPMPNGERINIGAYGNSPLASRSPTNPWLLALNYNDGGLVKGIVPLRWTSGNQTNGTRVRIEYSRNEGAEWSVLVSNVQNSAEVYMWDASAEPPTSKGKWRVVSESNPLVLDENDNVFAVKNETLTIFVNDGSTAGDVFTTAIGNATNDGLSASAPLLDPREAFSRYPLGAGDLIYIDSGNYDLPTPLVLNQFTRGITGLPIRIMGSTNAAGPSILTVSGTSGTGLIISDTSDIELEHLQFVGGSNVVRIIRTERVKTDGLRVLQGVNGLTLQNAREIELRRFASAQNAQLGIQLQVSDAALINCVLYGNLGGAIDLSQSSFSMVNSIVDAAHSTSAVIRLNQSTLGEVDFNLYSFPTNANFARDLQFGFQLLRLSDWQRYSGKDIHSVRQSAAMNNPAAGDFTLPSQAGRFDVFGALVSDATNSWAIDAGRFTDSFANESSPNGGRINAGIFGDTRLASRSATSLLSRALLAATMRDGGTTSGTVPLYWLSRAFSATSQVNIFYSLNGGLTWEVAASNYPNSNSVYLWNSAAVGSSPLVYWRVCSVENTNLCDTVGPFTLRNGPIAYYVNDTNTSGDIYTSAPGNSTNNALSPATPQSSIRYIFDQYDLDGGDAVYVDTGLYVVNSDVFISTLDSGVATAPVRVVGSDLFAAGGTRIQPAVAYTASVAFTYSGASFVNLDKLTLQGFDSAIQFQQQSQNNTMSNLLIRDGGRGLSFNLSSGNRFHRSIITRMAQTGVDSSISAINFIENSVIWNTTSNAVVVGNGAISVSNSILNAPSGLSLYALLTNGLVVGDYNAYHFSGASTFLQGSGRIVDRLPQWTQVGFQEFFSLHTDPLFADPTNDLFYLRSSMGRYDPITDTFVTTDTNTSLLVDSGPVEWDFGLEPAPNGARINIGPHGNTPRASKSRTNAWIKTITAMGGGRLEGLVLLTWNYNNIPETETVILDYSFNNGVSWTNIGTTTVSAMSFLWQSDQKFPGGIEKFQSSPIARWKITLASNTNIWDMTENYFSLRNKLFVFYVNDTNTAGDIYTCGPGNDANLGIFPCEPKATLASLLEQLDLEGEDTVLIDTGVYNFGTNESAAVVGIADEGKPGLPVIIRGSTNFAAGGSVFDRPIAGSSSTLLQIEGRNVVVEYLTFRRGNVIAGAESLLRHLTFTNANALISGDSVVAEKCIMVRGNLSVSGKDVAVREFLVREGTMSASGTNVLILNNLIVGTNTAPALTLDGNNVMVRNNTIATRGTAVRKLGFGSATLYNNILKADGVDRFCIDAQTGALDSDYNNLWAVNNAWVGGYRNGNWEKLHYWQREALLDLNSIAANPRFANESAGDYRLQSIAGRWNGTTWVTDTNHSPSIDMGSPVSAFTNEPMPNGGLVNQGYDGNTAFASLSRTDPWLMAVTMNDGGVLKGTNTLKWRYGNISTSAQVVVQYSPNNGATWTNISGPVPVTAGNFVWDSTPLGNSLQAAWRVVLVGDTNISDRTDTTFQLRNTPLALYLNDTNTVGDVFTTAPGSDANNGLTPATPMRTLQALLETYDTEGGDTIYVDTGLYPISSLNRINWSRGGDPSSGQMLIRGSTNLAAGGSIFSRNSSAPGNNVIDLPAAYVELRDITVQNGFYGVLSSSNRFITMRGLFARSNEFGVGFNASFNALVRNARIWANRQGGIENLAGRTTTVENVTFVANSNYSYRMVGTIVDRIQNNIFMETSTNSSALAGSLSSVNNAFIDYNVYYLTDPAATIYGTYTNLLQWQLDKQKDYRSAITNPLMNNANAGDFTLRSQFGRWQAGIFVNDAETSWAIDRGNPASVFTNETAFNGGRINIGAFGNTPFASRSSTNPVLETRTLNSAVTINDNSPTNIFPLIWGAINVPTGLIVNVQFSGDGGLTWYTLATNVNAYQEYILWQATPFFNTANGRWRVVGVSDTNYVAINSDSMNIFYGQFQISQILTDFRTNSIVFRGAWNEHYQVQWATNLVGNAYQWWNAVNGPGPNEKAGFLSTNGGDFIYRDIESAAATNTFRVYRVLRLDMEP